MLDSENVPTESETASSPTPRRRRAASRPAGAPRQAESSTATVTAQPEPAADLVEVASEIPVPASEAPFEVLPEVGAAELKPKRRRASTKIDGESPRRRRSKVVPVSESEVEQPGGVSAEEDEPKPKKSRSKSKAAKSQTTEAPELLLPIDTDEVSTPDQAPAEVIAEEAPKAKRRRSTRRAAAPEPAPEVSPDDDPIAAALRKAEEQAGARKVDADPFITAQDRQQQLAALAGAIAAEASAEQQPVAEDTEEPDEDSTEVPQEAELDAESDPDEGDQSGEEGSDEGDEKPSRRRRRRGGRRRRRVGRDDEPTDEAEEGDPEEPAEEGETPEGDSADEEGNGVTRRRRRRRRRGEDKESSAEDEVTGIEGSTRMEAMRQRRKESRAAGRRRVPILSEAEFLARRESVDRQLVIRQGEEYTQLAVVEDNVLVEHYVDKASATSLIGNIYVGKVQNVLPSMEAAFIDIGRGRNAVLYAGEVDWAAFGVTGEDRKVENVLKSGQSVLVQVTKDPVGAKGARLTSHISLPGRYIVYSPGGHLSGISRKLPDVERNRLRDILSSLITDEESVIVRTAAEGAAEEELIRDVNRLKAQWEVIEKKAKQGGAPQALYAEPDLTLRIVRDLFTEDFGSLVVQGDGGAQDQYDAIAAYVSHVAPRLAERVVKFEVGEDGKDVFAQYKIDEQIAKALDRKVFLPSGGSLVIDRTEAMTVIDVNTGRFTGSGGNLEATVTSNNLEAAEEIVRQLRLRDLGGIIVIDFIDMVLPSNRELLLRRLVECLGRDRTRHQVAEVTSLGLVQLTRKRIGTGLQEAFTEECEHCHGSGYLKFDEPVDSQAPADGGERKQSRRRRR